MPANHVLRQGQSQRAAPSYTLAGLTDAIIEALECLNGIMLGTERKVVKKAGNMAPEFNQIACDDVEVMVQEVGIR